MLTPPLLKFVDMKDLMAELDICRTSAGNSRRDADDVGMPVRSAVTESSSTNNTSSTTTATTSANNCVSSDDSTRATCHLPSGPARSSHTWDPAAAWQDGRDRPLQMGDRVLIEHGLGQAYEGVIVKIKKELRGWATPQVVVKFGDGVSCEYAAEACVVLRSASAELNPAEARHQRSLPVSPVHSDTESDEVSAPAPPRVAQPSVAVI
eukprot:COSAG06_NODE_12266_length_1402_cov_1.125863_2_plen_208_part_00